jgi:hypothetical protein
MKRLAGAALMAVVWVSVSVCGQERPAGFPTKMTEAPSVLPVGCPAGLVEELREAAGTPDYRRLNGEIASMKLGHSASQKLQAALSQEGKAGGNLLRLVVPVMTALAEAQNIYLCASFLAGLDAVREKDRGEQDGLLVSVNNRMALQTWQLQNVLSSEAAGAQTGKATSQAGRTAAIFQDRKEAGSDLVRVVAREETLLIDTAGAGGAQADWLRITCGERSRLLSALLPLAKSSSADEFTVAASLLQDFLQRPHRCLA